MSDSFDFDDHYIVVPNRQPITGMQEFNGKVYVFTRDGVFTVVPKKIRWYRRLWWRLAAWYRGD